MAVDQWKELCELVKEDDGLPVRDAGEWTREKLFFWHRYIEITTRAMAGNPKWSGLTYIDLFAGPGICRSRESKTRFPGSCLIAANASKAFTKLILCEEDIELSNALQLRISAHGAAHRTSIITGDCNDRINEITSLIPSGALNVAFVDPTGLHHRFETIKKLTQGRRMDLLVLFADSYDIHRNFKLYDRQTDSNLDAVLGPNSDWRSRIAQVPNQDRKSVCRFFADLYTEQLQKNLGYDHFGQQMVLRDGTIPLYRLIYASKDARGVDFWNKAIGKNLSGQSELF